MDRRRVRWCQSCVLRVPRRPSMPGDGSSFVGHCRRCPPPRCREALRDAACGHPVACLHQLPARLTHPGQGAENYAPATFPHPSCVTLPPWTSARRHAASVSAPPRSDCTNAAACFLARPGRPRAIGNIPRPTCNGPGWSAGPVVWVCRWTRSPRPTVAMATWSDCGTSCASTLTTWTVRSSVAHGCAGTWAAGWTGPAADPACPTGAPARAGVAAGQAPAQKFTRTPRRAVEPSRSPVRASTSPYSCARPMFHCRPAAKRPKLRPPSWSTTTSSKPVS